MSEYSCLVVEDSPMMRQLLVFALARLKNLRVTEADDGVDGLKKLASAKFDIILTDINMPIMDGLKLVKRVRSDPTHKDTPIVIITTEGANEDRQRALQLGANAYITKPIQAPQVIELRVAKEIARAVRGRVELVGVFANRPLAEMLAIKDEVVLDWIQLHGDESPALTLECGPRTMKALRVAEAADVAQAELYPGKRLLVDAKVAGSLGGTGRAFDWSLVGDLAGQRELVLAGGLGPDNVQAAVEQVRPFGIDTASGVESAPGAKSPEATRA